jgi:ArsR family transcriptional regulator
MLPENLFKGLADPTRLRIAMLLLDTELCVCDLMAVLQLPQSTVSRHMGRLKTSEVVVDRRYGKWVHYRLAETPSVNELRIFLERSFSQLGPYKSDRVLLKRLVRSGNCASVSSESSTAVRAAKAAVRIIVPGFRS